MAGLQDLHTLCSLCGMHIGYDDIEGRRQRARPESLVAVLRAMGVSLDAVADAPRAIRTVRRQRWRRPLEPVVVGWDGQDCAATLRLPASRRARVECALELEDGETREWRVRADRLPVEERATVDGEKFTARRLRLRGHVPPGYHRLRVDAGPRARAAATVIVSPRRAFQPPRRQRRTWGVFAPCYALHSDNSLGVGDLGDLERLLVYVNERGGETVGTLPLLAAYLGTPFEHSPYAPVSRQYWNELYLDLDAVPETGPAVRQLMGSKHFQSQRHDLQSGSHVDYLRSMEFKRNVLERMARVFFANKDKERFADFRRFVRGKRDVERYARFRAVAERRRSTWQNWPQRMQEGTFRPGDYSAQAQRYHLYVQFLAHEQMGALSARHPQGGLYLDLPLGVHGGGYDVWAQRDQFLEGVSVGAPPDTFFTRGQNWGFPPPHPQQARKHGHDYFRDVLRHHMRVAGVLRIDHIMGFHRLYCIPHGADATDGVYVRYPAEEFYAIAALESHRNRTVVVGEDLGTVPRAVRRAMGRHGIQRTHVVQYDVSADSREVAETPSRSVASLNTHDMPTFNAFWRALDVRDRVDLGLLDNEGARRERSDRGRVREAISNALARGGWRDGDRAGAQGVVRALLAALAASPAWMVLVNLEDLWGESSPQNVPGTSTERANWQRKMRYSLDEIIRKPMVTRILETIDKNRRKVQPR